MPTVHEIVHDGALFARSAWKHYLLGTPVDMPQFLNEDMQAELSLLARQMAAAMNAQYTLSWDSKTYYEVVRTQDGRNPAAEERFRRQFSQLDTGGLMLNPLSVWDVQERLELLYLPRAITSHREANIRTQLKAFSAVTSKYAPKEGNSNWRDAQEHFRNIDFCEEFGAGVLNLALAWHMTAQESIDDPVFPSKHLGSKTKPSTKAQTCAQDFVGGLDETAVLLSAALAIAHPEQYELTRTCLEEVSKDQNFSTLAGRWAFVFNVITLVVNRSTPVHRDLKSGGRGFLDLLLSIGGGPHTVIEFPGMGLRLQYDSGTMLLFSGHVHPHGVSVAREERACFACYARQSVQLKEGLPLPRSARLESMLYRDI